VARARSPDSRVIAADGNFQFKPEPFVVELMNSEVNGKRHLAYENVGNAGDAAKLFEDEKIDEAILSVLANMRDGVGERDLRTNTNEQLKMTGAMPNGVRGARISIRASDLKSRGLIDREVAGQKRWRST
jgi:hypothetical protein